MRYWSCSLWTVGSIVRSLSLENSIFVRSVFLVWVSLWVGRVPFSIIISLWSQWLFSD